MTHIAGPGWTRSVRPPFSQGMMWWISAFVERNVAVRGGCRCGALPVVLGLLWFGVASRAAASPMSRARAVYRRARSG